MKLEATWVGCWVGEPCGELLANDDRSEAELWIEMSFGRYVSPLANHTSELVTG